MNRQRVFFYVQHLLGIGHLRRAATIARALEEHGFAVAFVSGGAPVAGIDIGGAEMIQLPPARSGERGLSEIVDEFGAPLTESWWQRRRGVLLDAFARFDPAAVLIELYPFGRRPFRAELLPLLDAAHARRPRPAIACSVRDILVGKSDPRRLRETVDIVKRYFDRILVHGDPRLVEFGATFAAADEIAERIGYTGYVVTPPAQTTDSLAGQGEVLVSAGGGAVGAPLLRAALAARPLTTLASAPWRVLTGHNLSEADFGALRATADSGITVERFRPDFQARLHSCRLSVSQAGYNTVMEILSAGARAVVVPFAEGGESEQPLRAELLSRRGLLTVVHPDRLNAASLAAAINHAAGRPAPHPSGIDMAGAENTAKAVADLLSATPHAAN